MGIIGQRSGYRRVAIAIQSMRYKFDAFSLPHDTAYVLLLVGLAADIGPLETGESCVPGPGPLPLPGSLLFWRSADMWGDDRILTRRHLVGKVYTKN
jgi:hypothetical protein